MDRIRGLEKIKSDEERDAKKAKLEYCVNEYVWLTKEKEPLKVVGEQLKAAMEQLSPDMSAEEKSKLLLKIHELNVKYTKIQKGTYKSELKQNITAYLIQIEQYDACKEKRKLWKVIRGVLANDADTKDYLRRRYMISRVNRYGVVPTAVDMRLDNPRDLVEYIIDKYDLVGIKKEDLALIPVKEAESISPTADEIKKQVGDKADKVINESPANMQPNAVEGNTAEKPNQQVHHGKNPPREIQGGRER